MKESKHQFIYLGFFILSLLFILIFTNIYVDPANIYHQIYDKVAKSIIQGNSTYVLSGNLDERKIKEKLILNMPRDVDCIAVGPSLVMCVDTEMTDENIFYNLGVSRADYYDILAQFGLMKLQGIKTKKVIFCVDTYFFDRILVEQNTRHERMEPYAEYMLSVLNAKDYDIQELQENSIFDERHKQLLSLSYFQSSLAWLKANEKEKLRQARYGIADDNYKGMHYLKDGSWIYDETFRTAGVEQVKKEANINNLESTTRNGAHIDEEYAATFFKLLTYLEENDVKVELYFCPYSPALWDQMNQEDYPILNEIHEGVIEYAKKHNLKITGSYNPYELNMTNEDFYDARHVRKEKLANYFDFNN